MEDSNGSRIIVPFKTYCQLQIEEIFGELNMYYTGINTGRPPTPQSATENYIEKGGAVNFAGRYSPKESKE